MNTWLLLAMVVVPTLEIWVVGDMGLSVGLMVLWSALTGGYGLWVVRQEELALWSDIEADLANRRLPTIDGLDAVLMLLGGWGLLVPGLLTDLLGGTLQVPVIRRLLVDYIRLVLKSRMR